MENRERVLAELDNFRGFRERGFCRMVGGLDRQIKGRSLDPSTARVFGSATNPDLWERHFQDFLAGRRGAAPDIDLVFDSIDAAEPWGGIPLLRNMVSVDAFAVTDQGVFDSSDDFSSAAEGSVPRLAEEVRRQARTAERLDRWLGQTARPACRAWRRG